MASPTPNLGLTYPAHGGAVNAWDTPLNTDFDTLDLVIAGTLAFTGGTASFGTSVNLTQTQANNRRIEISGVLTNNFVITFPAIGGEWVMYNTTTGSFTVTALVTASAVTPITLSQGLSRIVNSNGVDLFDAVTSDTNTWTGATYAGSDVSPAAVATDQNDYNPASLSTATCLRLNITAACSITGLQGGAAGRDLELVNIGTATVKFPANSGSSSAANQFANTFNLVPGQSIFLRYDATSSLWRPKNIATAYSSCALAAIGPDLLIVPGGSPNTTIAITASESILVDASGNAIKFENISVGVDSTTTGPGGCDTGTRAASTKYFNWLVSDGVSINSVISTSSTFATVLTNLIASGSPNYIYGKRIGWRITDGSSNFKRIRQVGRIAQYIVGTNPANTVNLTTGTAGTPSTTSPTLAALSVANAVPSTAVAVHVGASNGGNGFLMIAPNTAWGGTQNGPAGSNNNVFPIYIDASGASVKDNGVAWIVLESTDLAYTSNSANTVIGCFGWEDNI